MMAMQDFTLFMLEAFANFCMMEPIIYLFGAILFCFLCKGIKSLM